MTAYRILLLTAAVTTAEEMRGGGSASEGGAGVRPTLGPGGVGGKVDF